MAWSHFVILTVLIGSVSLMTISQDTSPGSRDSVLSRHKRTIGPFGPVSFGRVNLIGARLERILNFYWKGLQHQYTICNISVT